MMKRVVIAGLALVASAALSTAGAQAADAKTIYEANCRKCHGATGTPLKAMATKFPKLAPFDAAFFAKRTDDSVVKVLTKGMGGMDSFKDKISAADMLAVSKYIHGFAATGK